MYNFFLDKYYHPDLTSQPKKTFEQLLTTNEKGEKMKKLMLTLAMLFYFVTSAIAGINVNTADLAALESLSGIGPKKAQAIIDYRTENGNFSSIEDLTNVKGIGEKLLAKIKDLIEVK